MPPARLKIRRARSLAKKRRARAAVKSAIAKGARSPVEVLEKATADPGGPEGTLRITDFLMSLKAIGATKTLLRSV